jgi:hypothetical protein
MTGKNCGHRNGDEDQKREARIDDRAASERVAPPSPSELWLLDRAAD